MAAGDWTYDRITYFFHNMLNADQVYNSDWKGDIDGETHAVQRLGEILRVPLVISYQFPELMGPAYPFGIASEEIRIGLNPPFKYSERDKNDGKKVEEYWYPATFTYYDQEELNNYFKQTIEYRDPYLALSIDRNEVGKFTAEKMSAINNAIADYYNHMCRSLLGRGIVEVWKVMHPTEVFDPSKDYTTFYYDTILQKNKAKYIRVKNSDGSKVATIARNIPANTVTDWNDAIRKGLMCEMHLITEHNRPGWGSDNTSKKENCESFVKTVLDLIEEAQTSQEGYTISGSRISTGTDLTKYTFYILNSIISNLAVEIYSSIINNEAFRAFNSIKFKSVKDFGDILNISDVISELDAGKIYGILVDDRTLKIRNQLSYTRTTGLGEKDFTNYLIYKKDHFQGLTHTFIHVFKDK